MSHWRFLWIVVAAVALQSNVLALPQNPTPPPVRPVSPFDSLSLPPVPYDPLELATGDAQPIQNAEERAAALSLLAKAHDLSNVRARAYDLKTTFTSYGSSSSDGSWILEDTSPSRDIYRWTAQGPSYSAVYLTANRLLSSNQPAEAIPLRLTQAREAIFYVYPEIGPRVSLRVANGNLNGLEVRCILVGRHESLGRASTNGRDWLESEYCVDPASGLLATYSPVPGLYIHYDYSNAVHFHNRIIPGAFTISEAGRPVIEAKTEGVTDPPGPDSSLFSPSGLRTLGAGPIMSPPLRIRSFIGMSHGKDSNPVIQMVVLHGVASQNNHFIEGELLATSDSGMNQAAMDHADKWPSCTCETESQQPGATPRSREAIFVVEFITSGK